MLLGGRPTQELAEEVAQRGCGMGCATGGGRHAIVVPLFGGIHFVISSVSKIMKITIFSVVYLLLSTPPSPCSRLLPSVFFQ